jgi:hypothetical protein
LIALLKALSAALFAAILFTVVILGINLINFVKNDTEVIVSNTCVRVGQPTTIKVPNFNKYDRIYLILSATTPIYNLTLRPKGILTPLPLDVEGVEADFFYPILSTKNFFFVANAGGSAELVLYMQPKTPYAVKEFEGKTIYEVFRHNEDGKEYLGVSLRPVTFSQSGFTQTLLAYPLNVVFQPDFQVEGELRLLEGKIAYVNLIVATDSALYAFNIMQSALKNSSSIKFNVNAGTRELLGRTGAFLGQRGLFIGLSIGLHDQQFSSNETTYAVLGIGNITIMNGGEKITIQPQTFYEYDLNYRLYIFHKFQPTLEHVLLISALASQVLASSYVSIKLWRSGKHAGQDT